MSNQFKFSWHGPRAQAAIRREIARRLRACAMLVSSTAKRLLSVSGTALRREAEREYRAERQETKRLVRAEQKRAKAFRREEKRLNRAFVKDYNERYKAQIEFGEQSAVSSKHRQEIYGTRARFQRLKVGKSGRVLKTKKRKRRKKQ